MAYVIAEPCIGVKDTACVDACKGLKKPCRIHSSRAAGICDGLLSTTDV